MLLYLLVPPKSLFCPSNSVYSPPQTIVLSPQIPNHLSSPQNNCSVPSNSVSSRSQNHSVPSKVNCPPKLPVIFREKWGRLTLCICICHKTVNKALNDEEIVYFGTILMIKTCFGTKLMIKMWFTHFLSLVEFVAIYALLEGPIRPYICGRGTPTDFKGWVLQVAEYCTVPKKLFYV